MIEMRVNNKVNYFVFILSLLLGIFLELLPVPAWVNWYKPDWLLLIGIFWVMTAPEIFNVVFIWMLGLFLDALKGSLLGEHAFAMLIVIFIFLKFQRRFRLYSLAQQTWFILLFVILYHFIIFIIQGTINELPNNYAYWGACLTSMFFWPSSYLFLRDWNKKFMHSPS